MRRGRIDSGSAQVSPATCLRTLMDRAGPRPFHHRDSSHRGHGAITRPAWGHRAWRRPPAAPRCGSRTPELAQRPRPSHSGERAAPTQPPASAPRRAPPAARRPGRALTGPVPRPAGQLRGLRPLGDGTMPPLPRSARGRALCRGARRRRRRPRHPGAGDLCRAGAHHGPGVEERLTGGPSRDNGAGRPTPGRQVGEHAPAERDLGRSTRETGLQHPLHPGPARGPRTLRTDPPTARTAGGGAAGRRRHPGDRRTVGPSGAVGPPTPGARLFRFAFDTVAPSPGAEHGSAASPGRRSTPGRTILASAARQSRHRPTPPGPGHRSARSCRRRRRHHRSHAERLRPGAEESRCSGFGRTGPDRHSASRAPIHHDSTQSSNRSERYGVENCSNAIGLVRLRRSQDSARVRHARVGGTKDPIWCTLCGITHRRFPMLTRTVRLVSPGTRGPSRGDRR